MHVQQSRACRFDTASKSPLHVLDVVEPLSTEKIDDQVPAATRAAAVLTRVLKRSARTLRNSRKIFLLGGA